MEDITDRGTFIKRTVLFPTVLELFKKYTKNKTVAAEFGCGDGAILQELVKLGIAKEVYGIDFNEQFINSLRLKYPEKRSRFLVQDITGEGLRYKFDLIVCSMVLLDMPEIDRALDNIFNSLNQDGKIIIADINSDTYKAIGFWENGKFIKIHNPENVFHTEKMISGHTKAVHNYHPFNYYRSFFERKGMSCLEDFIIAISKESVLNQTNITSEDKERLIAELEKDFANPPFHVIVLAK